MEITVVTQQDTLTYIIPAAAAIAGVILGGILQIWQQKKREDKRQLYEIRKRISQGTKSAMDYAAIVNQFATEVDQFIRKVLEANEAGEEPDYEEITPTEYLDRLADGLIESFGLAFRDTLQLINVADSRVSKVANRLHLNITDAHNNATHVFKTHQIDKEKLDAQVKEIRSDADLLVAMVKPGDDEQLKFVRSVEEAEREMTEEPIEDRQKWKSWWKTALRRKEKS